MLHSIIISLFLISFIKTFELNKWMLLNSNGTIKINKLTSPIDVYSALFSKSIIKWPLNGYNDELYRWIGYDDWSFIGKPFSVDMKGEYALLISNLDVAPRLWLNDYEIKLLPSQFISQIIKIPNQWLNSKENNRIILYFESPVKLAKEINQNSTENLQPDCWPKDYRGECYINRLRKTQSTFSWDWGPAIPTMGIRGKIEFINTKLIGSKISSIQIHTREFDNCKTFKTVIIVKLDKISNNGVNNCVYLQIKDLKFNQLKCLNNLANSITYNLNYTELDVKLWWPYEMGTPVLYILKADLFLNSTLVDNVVKYVGFRSVELNQNKMISGKGNSFEFLINCKSFYSRGANYIPRTYFTLNWTDTNQIKYLFASAISTNLNTIRVSGTGQPELERFYEIADNLGIMVWHDLFFACAQYSTDTEFMKTVEEEVKQIVNKLEYHPSNLIWAGNNEIEVMLAEGWYNLEKRNKNNIRDYMLLFDKVVKPAVKSQDFYNPFILSSPTNGDESYDEGGVAKDPQSSYFGDVHYYRYTGDFWNEESYPITRMTSEFGFQSIPEISSWDKIIIDMNDYSINGKMMQHRQHHPNGNQELSEAIKEYFGKFYPQNITKLREQLNWYSYLSQINQAEILRVHINRLRSHIDDPYKNRGAIFWQLNDIWVAPSWSTIDAYGKWKIAQYFIKNAFSYPMRITINKSTKSIGINIILPLSNVDINQIYSVKVICYNLQANSNHSRTNIISISFQPNNSIRRSYEIYRKSMLDVVKECKCPSQINCAIEAHLFHLNISKSQDIVLLAERPRHIKLKQQISQSKLSIYSYQGNPDASVCIITLKNNWPHLYVNVYANYTGWFSDNGFHMFQPYLNVTFYPWYSKTLPNLFVNCSSIEFTVISLNPILY